MSRLVSATVIFIASLGLMSCGSDDESNAATTPTYAAVTCTATDCADNSANGKVFYYAIVTNSDTCAGITDSTTMSYVKGPVTCSGGSCIGTNTTSFLSTIDDTAVSVPAAGSSYSVFYFIDTDGDEGPSNGEPGNCQDS